MKRDDLIFDIIEREHQRQKKGIELIASENFVSDHGVVPHKQVCRRLSRPPLLWRMSGGR